MGFGKADCTRVYRRISSISSCSPQPMLPFLGDGRRKNINLGGSSSVSSRDATLALAKVGRLEREETKQQQRASAVKIQRWWREISMGRRVRVIPVVEQAVRENKDGKFSLEALRSVVFIGSERVLAMWAGAVVLNLGGEYMFQLGRTVNNTVIFRPA
jgi:ubiquitin-protein ligase E3 C